MAQANATVASFASFRPINPRQPLAATDGCRIPFTLERDEAMRGMNAARVRAMGGILLGLTGALGAPGCAGPAPTPQPVAPLPAVTTYDGRYAGTVRVTGSAGSMREDDCATPPRLSIELVDGRFSLPVPHPGVATTTPSLADRTTPVYEASIAPDGRISGRSNQTNTTLEGQVSGRQISGQIYGLLCYYEFSANRL